MKVSDLWQTRSLAFSEICPLMLFRIAWMNKLWLSWSIFVVTKGTYYGHMKILGCFHIGHSHISGHRAPKNLRGMCEVFTPKLGYTSTKGTFFQNSPSFLVGGLEHFFIFPYIGNVIIPIDFHIFQRGGPGPPTSFSPPVRLSAHHGQLGHPWKSPI